MSIQTEPCIRRLAVELNGQVQGELLDFHRRHASEGKPDCHLAGEKKPAQSIATSAFKAEHAHAVAHPLPLK